MNAKELIGKVFQAMGNNNCMVNVGGAADRIDRVLSEDEIDFLTDNGYIDIALNGRSVWILNKGVKEMGEWPTSE